jgi:hypothetical protein
VQNCKIVKEKVDLLFHDIDAGYHAIAIAPALSHPHPVYFVLYQYMSLTTHPSQRQQMAAQQAPSAPVAPRRELHLHRLRRAACGRSQHLERNRNL